MVATAAARWTSVNELIDLALKYVILPVGGFVWMMHNKLQAQSTEIAVMKTEMAAAKEARNVAEAKMEKTVDAIFAKLDSIEQALRKPGA